MKVIDIVNKTELDLTVEQLIDLVANHNRQVASNSEICLPLPPKCCE